MVVVAVHWIWIDVSKSWKRQHAITTTLNSDITLERMVSCSLSAVLWKCVSFSTQLGINGRRRSQDCLRRLYGSLCLSITQGVCWCVWREGSDSAREKGRWSHCGLVAGLGCSRVGICCKENPISWSCKTLVSLSLSSVLGESGSSSVRFDKALGDSWWKTAVVCLVNVTILSVVYRYSVIQFHSPQWTPWFPHSQTLYRISMIDL